MTTSIVQPAYDATKNEKSAIGQSLDQLRYHQQQLDMDGIIVGVSRQALHEVLEYIAVDAAMAVMDQTSRALLEDAAKALELFACDGKDRYCSPTDFCRKISCENDQARATLAKIKEALK